MRRKTVGPRSPVVTPPGQPGDVIDIVFGHNAGIRKVLMQLSVTASQLVLDPDAAEHVASQLLEHAKLARGTIQ